MTRSGASRRSSIGATRSEIAPGRRRRRDPVLQRERHPVLDLGWNGGRRDDDTRDRPPAWRAAGAVRNGPAVGPGGEHRRGRRQRRHVHPRGPHRRLRQRHGSAGSRPRARSPATGTRSALGTWRCSPTSPPSSATRLGAATVAERAASAAYLGVDALLISGPAAGVDASMSDLREAKAAVDIPVLANTGVKHETVAQMSRRRRRRDRRHQPQGRRQHLEPRRPRAGCGHGATRARGARLARRELSADRGQEDQAASSPPTSTARKCAFASSSTRERSTDPT